MQATSASHRIIAIAASLLCLPGCQTRSGKRPPATERLVAEVLDSMRVRNARLETVQVLSVTAIPWSTSRLALLARAAAPGDFNGRFEDELFCVFVVDSTLTHLVRLVDSIPTRRWHDYEMRFESIGPDSLYVVGSGATYGDEGIRRSYDWNLLIR